MNWPVRLSNIKSSNGDSKQLVSALLYSAMSHNSTNLSNYDNSNTTP